jgi:GLPGLI family protein
MKLSNCFIFTVASVLTIFSTKCFAQKTVNEATLHYNISIESVSDKPSLSKSLDGAVLTLYITGSESRADMVSTLGTESNIYSNNSGKGYILKEYSGQKLMITLSRENWVQKNQYFQNLKFNLDNTETSIGGFKCKKATATLEGGKTLIVFYSTEVTTANKQYYNAFKNLPGIPVQYEQESGKLKFTYTLTGINYDNIPDSKFDIPKSGFRVMTYEENQQLKKG